MRKNLTPALCVLSGVTLSHAATITPSLSSGAVIPDGTSSGLTSVITVAGNTETIISLTVNLRISAQVVEDAFLGDLYISLTKGSGTTVLLNRPGRTLDAPYGYDDFFNLNLTFAYDGTQDVHTYRTAVSGDEGSPLTGDLTGIFQPDARTDDPAIVTTDSARSLFLSELTNQTASGDYTLFISDLGQGSVHVLDSWGMTIETVPEPSSVFLLGLASCWMLRRQRVHSINDKK